MSQILNNEKPSLCTSCGGKCCKWLPGPVHPDQLGEVTVDSILNKCDEGYCFDYWEGNLTGDPVIIPILRSIL